ncbi:MAG: magnesium/cobalt transporter CorA, partial [Gammaproteobacteria bacterium]|nr:magnesium/cobalt transporter CorA [Gammaproteobacteria bacterium]
MHFLIGAAKPLSQKKPRHHSKRSFPRLSRRTAPGAAPGSLIPDPLAGHPTVHSLSFDANRLIEERECTAASLPPTIANAVLWIDVVGLGDAELIQAMGDRYGLHQLALEDVLNVHQRPKVEDYDDHLYVVLRMVTTNTGADTEQISVFLAKGLVITFQERAGDCFEPIRQRIRQGKGRIRSMQSDYLVYAIIDAVVDGYFPVVDAVGEALAALEDDVVLDPRPTHIAHLHESKRDLLSIRRAIWPTRDMMSALLRDDLPILTDATQVYLRDAHDHTVQLIDIVETYREIASGLVDAYLSSQSTKLNEVMKFLTIMSTVFLP